MPRPPDATAVLLDPALTGAPPRLCPELDPAELLEPEQARAQALEASNNT
jgi:hypothetical protein